MFLVNFDQTLHFRRFKIMISYGPAFMIFELNMSFLLKQKPKNRKNDKNNPKKLEIFSKCRKIKFSVANIAKNGLFRHLSDIFNQKKRNNNFVA